MSTFQPSKYSGLPVTVAAKNSAVPAALGVAGLGVGAGLLIGILALPTFVITPWIVKQFKPEWSYGKRLATGFVVNFGVASTIAIARAASGGDKKAAATTQETKTT